MGILFSKDDALESRSLLSDCNVRTNTVAIAKKMLLAITYFVLMH